MKKAMKQSTMMSILNTTSIILLVILFACIVCTSVLGVEATQANKNRYDLRNYANLFMDGSASLTNNVRAYAATANITYYNNYWQEDTVICSRERGIEGMKEIGITQEEQAMIDQMSAISTGLEVLEKQAMDMAANGDTAAAIAAVYGDEYNNTIARIRECETQFIEALNIRSEATVDRMSSLCTLNNIVSIIALFLIAFFQIISILYNHRKIIQPILSIENEMEKIAEGNLSSEFSLEGDTSEIGALVNSIHRTKHTLKQYIGDISVKLSKMAEGKMDQRITLEYVGDFKPIQEALTTILDSLNRTLEDVSAASGQVYIGSSQVSQGAQSLAQGATEQASAVEELSATINDLSDRMDIVAGSAGNAKKITDEASGVLSICNEKMSKLVDAMKEISEASSEISKVIDAIESIAFQTNILALNAAVEAARAGSAGKGFTVVADEVRALANKSQEASKSTEELITRSLNAVERGTKIADETARSLVGVVEGTKQSSDHVREIAKNSQEQAIALRQLTEGVNQIADVVQTNSATSEESAAAAHELSDQASRMRDLMKAFQLRNFGG